MAIAIIIILFLAVIERVFRPRLDFTKEKRLFFWYGTDKRKYIRIL